jgi:hypothetical protein
VIARDWQWIAAVALVVSACAAPNEGADDDDALVPAVDAGAPEPATTDDVAGGWSFSATYTGESVPFVSCAVRVGGGVFDITCPAGQVPRVVHEGCQQLRDDLHLNGSISGLRTAHLDGMIDNLVEYEGAECIAYGYTTGAPYPLPAFAQMTAVQTEPVSLGDFLRHLGGRWDFALVDTRSASTLDCEVHLGVDSLGVKVAIACPRGTASPVGPCTEQIFDVVTAHILPGKLDGELARETRHTGSCQNQPPPTSVPVATMRARAE